MAIKDGHPYVRTWKGNGWNSNIKVNDNKWHHFAYNCILGKGQTMFIDGKEYSKSE